MSVKKKLLIVVLSVTLLLGIVLLILFLVNRNVTYIASDAPSSIGSSTNSALPSIAFSSDSVSSLEDNTLYIAKLKDNVEAPDTKYVIGFKVVNAYQGEYCTDLELSSGNCLGVTLVYKSDNGYGSLVVSLEHLINVTPLTTLESEFVGENRAPGTLSIVETDGEDLVYLSISILGQTSESMYTDMKFAIIQVDLVTAECSIIWESDNEKDYGEYKAFAEFAGSLEPNYWLVEVYYCYFCGPDKPPLAVLINSNTGEEQPIGPVGNVQIEGGQISYQIYKRITKDDPECGRDEENDYLPCVCDINDPTVKCLDQVTYKLHGDVLYTDLLI